MEEINQSGQNSVSPSTPLEPKLTKRPPFWAFLLVSVVMVLLANFSIVIISFLLLGSYEIWQLFSSGRFNVVILFFAKTFVPFYFKDTLLIFIISIISAIYGYLIFLHKPRAFWVVVALVLFIFFHIYTYLNLEFCPYLFCKDNFIFRVTLLSSFPVVTFTWVLMKSKINSINDLKLLLLKRGLVIYIIFVLLNIFNYLFLITNH